LDEDRSFAELDVEDVLQWEVASDEDALRLDAFLARRLTMLSRRERAALIAERRVLLNNRPAPKGAAVHAHDLVTAHVVIRLAPTPTALIIIVHADADVVVVNKLAGTPSVALRHSDLHTVANFLIGHFPETAAAGPHPLEAGLVHRLDTDTSGLLLAARTPAAYAALREQFRQRTVEKYYLALVEGILAHKGEISLALEPTGPQGRRMHPVAPGQGQPALTLYQPEEQMPAHTLVRVTLVTGVRHQIRAHLAVLGHPIVGDTLYGQAGQTPSRLCLHAETLSFHHPGTGQKMRLTSPPPEDFTAVLEQVRSLAGKKPTPEK
jgi:23S rRNA pseudouridine1911/1915/1917 synthase